MDLAAPRIRGPRGVQASIVRSLLHWLIDNGHLAPPPGDIEDQKTTFVDELVEDYFTEVRGTG